MSTAFQKSDTREAILEKAVALFARSGYSGVSMRDIANAVRVSATALYHHFPDKDALYLAAIEHAFSDKASRGRQALRIAGSPEQRVRAFVGSMVNSLAGDPDFRSLLHRELLDANERRLELMATQVFAEQVAAITELVEEIAPHFDPLMLVMSIAGMAIHHFESAPMRRFFPGRLDEHDDPDRLIDHITRLVLHGVCGNDIQVEE